MIGTNEDLLKIKVGWDDASGTSFSFVAFEDLWTVEKIKREYGYEARPMSDSELEKSTHNQGNHLQDQYGLMSTGGGHSETTPSGNNKLPKARITDYWGMR